MKHPEDFPGDVVNRAKYLILDNIGCALGGTQTELGTKYLRVSANWKGIPESTVIGTGTRVSCMNASYVNAQLANVLDFDDTYDLYSPGHPGNAIVQTAIALARKEGQANLSIFPSPKSTGRIKPDYCPFTGCLTNSKLP